MYSFPVTPITKYIAYWQVYLKTVFYFYIKKMFYFTCIDLLGTCFIVLKFYFAKQFFENTLELFSLYVTYFFCFGWQIS